MRRCDVCGKGPSQGNRVSKAKNRTRHTWLPNLVTMRTEIGGTVQRVKICTRCLRSGFLPKKVRVPRQKDGE